MNKFKLTIDTDSINMENEIHINNFSQKIKNLAQHCINFINGIDDETDCSNNRYLPEFHDDDSDSTVESSNFIPLFTKKKRNSNYDIYNEESSLLMHNAESSPLKHS